MNSLPLKQTIGRQLVRGVVAVSVSIMTATALISTAPFVFAGYVVTKGVSFLKLNLLQDTNKRYFYAGLDDAQGISRRIGYVDAVGVEVVESSSVRTVGGDGGLSCGDEDEGNLTQERGKLTIQGRAGSPGLSGQVHLEGA